MEISNSGENTKISQNVVTLSIDVMGGDYAPDEIIKGINLFAKTNGDVHFLLHGIENEINKRLAAAPDIKNYTIIHSDEVVGMDAKPSQAMRRKNTSMWGAIESVKKNVAHAAVSAGNTGALMAISNLQLRTLKGVHRPAITASWPNPNGGRSVVLDVGANVDSDPDQLVEFAIMGEAFAKAIYDIKEPSIGLLNVGTEDQKGHEEVREAMRLLREHGETLGLNVYGFVEGNDISMGTTDVVVTDGFTGNIALKSAEGAAKFIAKLLKDSLKADPLSMLGAVIASNGFNRLKKIMDPANFNGGVFLGLNGLVVKSHGGTNAKGFANALEVALKLAKSDYNKFIANNLERLERVRSEVKEPAMADK